MNSGIVICLTKFYKESIQVHVPFLYFAAAIELLQIGPSHHAMTAVSQDWGSHPLS